MNNNNFTDPYEIARFIKDAKKVTPVKLYIKGDMDNINFSNCKVFGCGDSRIVFGEYEVIEEILENNEDKIDAVVICALHKAQNKLVLINQYRVPINKYIYELPAGLVDNNEDIETSVRRELKEETGLDLISINKINSKDKLYLSPGMTDESVAFVYCLCDGEITDKYQEDDEDIKAMLISKEDAKNILENEESIDIKAYLMLQMFEKLGESLFI